MIVLIGGLPGTGKSTLAAAIGARLDALVIARDHIEAALWRSGIGSDDGSRRAADAVLLSVAADAAGQGRTIIVDSVFGAAVQRRAFTSMATDHAAPLLRIECTCSDRALHRSRIEGRVRGINGWPELTWTDVESTRSRLEPWTEKRLTIDAATTLDQNLVAALRYVNAGSAYSATSTFGAGKPAASQRPR